MSNDLAEALRRRSEAMEREAQELHEEENPIGAAQAEGAAGAFLWAARMAEHHQRTPQPPKGLLGWLQEPTP
jgi:hypothetical protein